MSNLKLYLIRDPSFKRCHYDTYREAVVAAPSETIARIIHPNNEDRYNEDRWSAAREKWKSNSSSWPTHPIYLECIYLGEAKKGIEEGVICASFNAG